MNRALPDRGLAAGIEQPTRPLASDEQTRAFLACIVESSDDSIIGTGLDGTIVSWNGGAERLWGYTAQEAIGRHITLLFLPDRRQDYLKVLGQIQRRERVERFESVRVRKHGTPIGVSVILSPIKDDRGPLWGVSAIYRNITERKRRDQDLLTAKEAAEAASRAKSKFVANMSHEIRTPMNGILRMLDVALDMELEPELRDYLETARASGSTLLVILNDLLDLCKIEAGRMELEWVPLSVATVVYEVLNSQAIMAQKKGLALRDVLGPDIPEVLLGDPTRLRRVLENLINNAVKFTERGFIEVRVVVQLLDAGEAAIKFGVTDTGVGMTAA
jgi:two-component system, sensor histidine kinase and response regulator